MAGVGLEEFKIPFTPKDSSLHDSTMSMRAISFNLVQILSLLEVPPAFPPIRKDQKEDGQWTRTEQHSSLQLGTDYNGNSLANTRLVLEMGKLPETRGYQFPAEDFISGYHLQFSVTLPNLPYLTFSVNTGQNKLRFFWVCSSWTYTFSHSLSLQVL